MEIRLFSPDDYHALIEIHHRLNIVWPERPCSPEAWAEADRNRSPKCKHQRWVAVEGGTIIGFASYGQSIEDYHPQRFYINAEVHPAYQRRGIGAALYEKVMEGLYPFEPRALRADAFTNLPQGFAFLQKRSFYEAFRETPVHLNIVSFDPSPYAGLESELNAQRIVIKTVSELEDDPDRDRKIYDLFCKTLISSPLTATHTSACENWGNTQIVTCCLAACLASAVVTATAELAWRCNCAVSLMRESMVTSN